MSRMLCAALLLFATAGASLVQTSLAQNGRLPAGSNQSDATVAPPAGN